MLKAIVVLTVLTAVIYGSYGTPADANDVDTPADANDVDTPANANDADTTMTNAAKASGLDNSRDRRAVLPSHCINYIYVMAYTSGIANAGADLRHKIRLQAKGLVSTQILPDLPHDDYYPKKGDLWKLSLRTFFGFTTCVTLNDIQRITVLAGNSDGWNIESIVTFAVVNKYYWELTSCDLNVFRWIDADIVGYKEFTLSLRTSKGQCLHLLYVMAYTSSQLGGGADLRHKIELRAKGITKTKVLPDLPGDDYLSSKGDLWKLSIKDFFGFSGCITKKDIQGIALLAGSNDGWHIDSVVTYVAVNQYNWELSSVNLEARRWVDADSLHIYKRFALSLVI